MARVTVNDVACEVEALKKYKKYLCYQAEMERPMEEYTPSEMQEILPTWNAKAIARGLEHVASVAERQEVFYPIYTKEECKADPQKEDVGVWFLPAEGNVKKPFVILNAGGAFQSVCSMAEAFPTAVHFNKAGYHVFCMNYRAGGEDVLPKPLEDLAAAYRFIVEHKDTFQLQSDDYIMGGFSAGGNITSLWGTEHAGYAHYKIRKPCALLLIYPVITIDRLYRLGNEAFLRTMFGEHADSEEYMDGYDTAKLINTAYPSCYIVQCADDNTVPVGNATLCKELLDQHKIPSELEIGILGGHGFGDGTGTDVEGWPERAIAWLDKISV